MGRERTWSRQHLLRLTSGRLIVCSMSWALTTPRGVVPVPTPWRSKRRPSWLWAAQRQSAEHPVSGDDDRHRYRATRDWLFYRLEFRWPDEQHRARAMVQRLAGDTAENAAHDPRSTVGSHHHRSCPALTRRSSDLLRWNSAAD